MSPIVGKKRQQCMMSNIQKRETFNKSQKLCIFTDKKLFEMSTEFNISKILQDKPNIELYILKITGDSIHLVNIATQLYQYPAENFFAQGSPIYDSDASDMNEFNATFTFSAIEGKYNNRSPSSDGSEVKKIKIINNANIKKVYVNESLNRLYYLEQIVKKNKKWVDILKTNYGIHLINQDQPIWKTFMKHNDFLDSSYLSKSQSGSGANILAFLKKIPLTKLKTIAKNRNICLTRKKGNSIVYVTRTTLEKRISKYMHNYRR